MHESMKGCSAFDQGIEDGFVERPRRLAAVPLDDRLAYQRGYQVGALFAALLLRQACQAVAADQDQA